KHGINATGGSTSSDGIRATGGGTGHGLNLQSGSGATGDALHCLANSTNGAGFSVTGTGNGCGAQFNGGGTGGHGIAATSGGGSIGDGFTATAASSNGNGVTFTHSGTGKDLNATTTPLTLAKTTNITGLNDIAATAIVSGGAITTSSGKVSEVALVDTLTTYSGNTVQTGDAYARLGAPAGASVSADVASIKTDTGTTIPGRLPSALTGAGNIKADAVAIGGDTSCPAHLVALGLSYVIGSVNDSSPTTGGFVGSSGLSTTVGDYNRAFLVFTSGANQGIGRAISGYTGSTTKTFSFTGGTGSSDAPFPAAPANTDSFLIIGRAANGT
ncbi:MAG TPA: hypothetical protein VFG04_20465, partial [Planctomycetaceae bacterium]|nr:hypothetical protein [Planctomycetaceae bacterium]